MGSRMRPGTRRGRRVESWRTSIGLAVVLVVYLLYVGTWFSTPKEGGSQEAADLGQVKSRAVKLPGQERSEEESGRSGAEPGPSGGRLQGRGGGPGGEFAKAAPNLNFGSLSSKIRRDDNKLKTYDELDFLRKNVKFPRSKEFLSNWTSLPLPKLSELHKSLRYEELAAENWFDEEEAAAARRRRRDRAFEDIPRKLHFTWKTAELFDEDMPELFRKIQMKWKYLNPNWEIKIWTDEECDRLIKDHYPEYYSFYSEMKVTAEKSDVFRYLVLDLHGGYYADMDMEPLQPLDGLAEALQKPGCMIGLEPEVHAVLVYNKYHVIGNAFLGARPGHPLWKGFLPHAMKNHYADKMPNELKDATSITGPIAMDRVIQSNPDLTRGCVFLQPDVTAPAFDVKQDMHTRCEHIIRTHKPIYLRGGEAPNPKVQLCRKISRLGNANKDYPVTSFMVHHWAHTWRDKIDEAEEERRRKVVEGETKTEEEAGGEEEAEEGKERKPKEKKIMAESNIGKDVIMPAVHLDVKAILSRSESLTNK